MPESLITQQQKDIDTLEKTTKELEITLALATSKVGQNEVLLTQVAGKLDLIGEKLHHMSDELVSTKDLEISVNSILNRHAAKVLWSALAVGVGIVLTWMGSIIK